MIMRDSKGQIVAEQNVGVTKEGSVVSTSTMYDNGKVVSQNISIRDNSGNVRDESILGGKLLP